MTSNGNAKLLTEYISEEKICISYDAFILIIDNFYFYFINELKVKN